MHFMDEEINGTPEKEIKKSPKRRKKRGESRINNMKVEYIVRRKKGRKNANPEVKDDTKRSEDGRYDGPL